MKKCPQCGYEPPYAYTGWMEPYLPLILAMLRVGYSADMISDALITKHGSALRYYPTPAMIEYIRKRYGIERKAVDAHVHRQRNREIAERYAAGGVTMAALAREFELSQGRVREIIIITKRETEKAKQAQLAFDNADKIEDVPLLALDLPSRVIHSLRNGGCETVGDAMKLSVYDLMRCGNFGKRSREEWAACLENLKLVFDNRATVAHEERPDGAQAATQS